MSFSRQNPQASAKQPPLVKLVDAVVDDIETVVDSFTLTHTAALNATRELNLGELRHKFRGTFGKIREAAKANWNLFAEDLTGFYSYAEDVVYLKTVVAEGDPKELEGTHEDLLESAKELLDKTSTTHARYLSEVAEPWELLRKDLGAIDWSRVTTSDDHMPYEFSGPGRDAREESRNQFVAMAVNSSRPDGSRQSARVTKAIERLGNHLGELAGFWRTQIQVVESAGKTKNSAEVTAVLLRAAQEWVGVTTAMAAAKNKVFTAVDAFIEAIGAKNVQPLPQALPPPRSDAQQSWGLPSTRGIGNAANAIQDRLWPAEAAPPPLPPRQQAQQPLPPRQYAQQQPASARPAPRSPQNIATASQDRVGNSSGAPPPKPGPRATDSRVRAAVNDSQDSRDAARGARDGFNGSADNSSASRPARSSWW